MKAIAVFVALLALPGIALAGSGAPSDPNAIFEGSASLADEPNNWGTSAPTFVTLPAWSARPIDSGVTYNFINSPCGQGIHRTAGNPWVKIPIHVPAGAIVSGVEFNFCDTGAGAFTAFWVRQVKNAAPVFTTLFGSVGTPGCVVQNTTLTPNQTIDNNANSYNIEINMGATDSTIQFCSARVIYRLQVSPAPATATFPNDVPTTHPFFRWIEALAAAGITGGCMPGSYCPNDPVTRGQMAVFISTALGLHFPN